VSRRQAMGEPEPDAGWVSGPAPGLRWIWLTFFVPFLAGLLAGVPGIAWALPLLAPATVYRPFAARVREGDTIGAWRIALLWALLLSAGVIALVLAWPGAARTVILHGADYRREMFRWIATGNAPENDWRQFLPRHLFHLVVFVLLTWASGGYLGLAFGTILIGFMSYFVGSFAAASGQPLLGALAAWVPWSVLRVLSFVLLGAVFARPLLVRRAWPFGPRDYQLMALAAAGLVTDVLVKALCAPGYGLLLREMAHGAIAPMALLAMAALYSGAPRAF
jgi:hypothetical protein